MVLRTLLLGSALLAFGACAAAQDVSDVLVVDRDGLHVWIALDGAPSGLAADSAPGRLSLVLQGFSLAEARRIVPMNGGPLTGVTLSEAHDGALLVLEGRFQSARAALREGGIWIALDGALSHSASADPRPARAETVAASAPSGFDSAPAPEHADTAGDARASVAEPVSPASGAAATAAGPESAGDGADEGGSDPRNDPASASAASDASDMTSGRCDATAGRVQDSPWDLDILTAHADCLVGMGQRDNGAGLYERVLAFEPTHYRAALGLARIREAQGRGDEAAELYDRAARAALTDGEALAAQADADRNRDGDER